MSAATLPGAGRFDAAEIEGRAARARPLLAKAGLDALLISSPTNFGYFTGFHSEFLVSPTRPWYVLVPREGEPVGIVPEVGLIAMRAAAHVAELRAWPSPRPADEGISLLTEAIAELPRTSGRIGCEIGPEQRLGMPAQDFLTLAERLGEAHALVDGSSVVRALRAIKSPAEIDVLREISRLASDGYESLGRLYEAGDTEATLCRKLRRHVLDAGADHAPFVAVTSDYPCYRDGLEILCPTERVLRPGDVLFVDSGFTLAGYFCDFNRSWAIGQASDEVRRAYELVHAATEAGLAAARPGARIADVFAAQADSLLQHGPMAGGSRMGHGLGLDLTEPPSVTADEQLELRPGMVITIEPGFIFGDGLLMVEEEAVAITADGAELLTRRAPAELPVIG
jgi:Xaa-Pro dipeptidase